MQYRQILVSVTACAAAAVLAACGGGGSHAAAVPTSATSTPAAGSGNVGSLGKSHIVIHVKRGAGRKGAAVQRVAAAARSNAGTKHTASAKSRTANTGRKAKYVAAYINGLQVTVTSGSSTQTIYADLSGSSALCTPTNPASPDNTRDATCTIAVPILGANETVTVDELDTTPNDDGSNGNAAGYGDGFPTGTNIVAAITAPETIAAGGGVATIALTPNPVTNDIFACEGAIMGAAGYGGYVDDPNPTTITEGDERMVFTAGTPATAQGLFQIDAGGYPLGVAGQPWSDVNASPTPITASVVSGTAMVAGEADPGAGLSANPTYGTSAIFADSVTESYINPFDSQACFDLVLDVKYDGSLTPSFVKVSNNLTAVNPYLDATQTPTGTQTQAAAFQYVVVPMSLAAPTPNTLGALDIGATATVTATDYEAVAIDSSASCNNASGTEIASITPIGSIDTTTWTQQFTITGVAAGTCALTVSDDQSGINSNSLTVTVLGS